MSWSVQIPRRDWWPTIKRGLAGHCPACGRGRLFGRFLKVESVCAVCGEELHHHRADDLPPYLVILVVGHMTVAALLLVETAYDWPMWLHMTVWPALILVLCLALIQPIKGAVIAHQWALRMHGFGNVEDEEAALRLRHGETDR